MRAQSNQGLIRVHRFLPVTEAEGPGLRAALWVQGCPIRCPGCANLPTWSFSAGEVISVTALFECVRSQPPIEGVTFVGGEPFFQAKALSRLGRLCQNAGLSVVTFSGYSYEDLKKANRGDWNDLLQVTDLLLAGPFIQEQRDFSRPWVGSHNQEFVFLTDRYCHLDTTVSPSRNGLEIQLQRPGYMQLNGLAPAEEISAFRHELAVLGLQTR